MSPRLDDHFVIYPCSILENTKMSTVEYRNTYGIETRHCAIGMSRRQFSNGITEIEELVVATSTMSEDNWRKTYIIAFFTTVIYNHRVAFFIMNYLQQKFGIKFTDYIEYIIKILEKEGDKYPSINKSFIHICRQNKLILNNVSSMSEPEGLNTVLSPHEAGLYLLLSNMDKCYEELKLLTDEFCNKNNYSIDEKIIAEVFCYQKLRMPSFYSKAKKSHKFTYNIPQYFLSLENNEITKIVIEPTILNVELPKNKPDSLDLFAATLVVGGHTVHLLNVEIDLR